MSGCDCHLNLLTQPVISTGKGQKLSLPGLFAAMARGEVVRFPSLRPHQRPAWHMFCVQLAALALWRGGRSDPPLDENSWKELLRGLTPDFRDDAPWCLVVADRGKPAFLQPPDPDGLKWSPVATPDALDMLITARNHDLKQQVMRAATPEDWLFALVSLQTMEGYNGAGNHGVARMNGGSSSRVLLGLAPAENSGDTNPAPGPWWQRDLGILLTARASGGETGPCKPEGKALIWLEPWPEGAQLDPQDLDPWFIEICRRVRLNAGPDGVDAERATSKKTRIDAKACNGVLDDAWAPVEISGNGKTLTLSENGRFDYKQLKKLLLSGNWELPACARPTKGERDMLLVAEAIARGNSKTGGFASRIVPVPGGVVNRLGAPGMKKLAEEQIEQIKQCDKALRDGLVLVAAGGDRGKVKQEHYAHTAPACTAFDTRADAVFFPALWDRVAANEESGAALDDARKRFRAELARAALEEFEFALPAIPCAALWRPRAETRARAAFFGSLKNARFDLPGSKEEDALEQA